MLSGTGTHVSATCISPEAASYLAANSDILPHHVSSREIFTDSCVALLHEGGRVRARIVKANSIKEKLEFVVKIVGQWINNGGIGRLDDDAGEGRGRELLWQGIESAEARKKGIVTVGRQGGDYPAVH